MNTAKKTEELFVNISQFVEESHALLKQGAILEMEGLDECVRVLCEEVIKLSQEERVRYAVDLQKLFLDLKALGETLQEKRDAIAAEISNLSQFRKASVAYRSGDTADAAAPKAKDDE